jgi:hypothetical protein
MEVSEEWLYVLSNGAMDRIGSDGFQWETVKLHSLDYRDFTVVKDEVFLLTGERREAWH